jgi:MarR family transcriptional regulator for hemolysin
METAGPITRRRDPASRRIHVVELTEAGESSFGRLRAAAFAFDAQLRQNVTEDEVAPLESMLGRLAANVAPPDGRELWAGLAEDKPPEE